MHGIHRLPLFEIARVLVRFDHVACFIVNANQSIMRAAVNTANIWSRHEMKLGT
jgi:hypothetical protein